MLAQGFNLMLFGMGTVFIFLTLLVFACMGMSSALTKWFPEQEPPPNANTPIAAGSNGMPAHVRQVIEAAIAQHRQARDK